MPGGELEARLWATLFDAADGEPGRTVRISKLADDHLPVPHKQWTTEVVRRWDNDGLVIARQNGARAMLTEDGARMGRGLDR